MLKIKIYFDNNAYTILYIKEDICIIDQISTRVELQDYDIFIYYGGRVRVGDTAHILKMKNGDVIDAFKSLIKAELPENGIKFRVPNILLK
jgi:hypothetical protein